MAPQCSLHSGLNPEIAARIGSSVTNAEILPNYRLLVVSKAQANIIPIWPLYSMFPYSLLTPGKVRFCKVWPAPVGEQGATTRIRVLSKMYALYIAKVC